MIGITSTVPIEIIMAGGEVPVDLNNLFITHPERSRLLSEAERFGFPNNQCSWVKGIFQVAIESGIKKVVGVTRGDCSSTEKLMEIFNVLGIKSIPFAYPANRDRSSLLKELNNFARHFGTNLRQAERVRKRLSGIRRKLSELDRMTWHSNQVSGFENHLWLVSASDFNRDTEKFEKELEDFLREAENRPAFSQRIRLGYIGVPPIFDDLYEILEQMDARVVYNETQREFAMIKPVQNLVEQYLKYTYPYDIFYRVKEIKKELKKRKVDGVIHYAQTFCHRQMESVVFKRVLNLPVLSLEGDRPGMLDARTRTRLEAFVEMLKQKV